jgi:putative endonuclease
MPTYSKMEVGRLGEEIALDFLIKNGYRFIERNWRFEDFGEIDIVCVKGEKLVFVEVKTQVGSSYKEPEEAVDERKIRALSRTGWMYSETHPKLLPSLRIDVVGIILNEDLSLSSINLFENVFEENG